jgi:parallel beta-helix repeat protein
MKVLKTSGQFFFTLALFLFLGISLTVFAGTLTNTSFTSSNNIVDETTTLTFEYTNETLVNSTGSEMVFRGDFGGDEGGAMFDFSAFDLSAPELLSDVTVTLDAEPATVTYAFGFLDEDISYFEVRIAENVDPGTAIVVTVDNVVNQSTAGEYSVYDFGTADTGGILVDTPGNQFEYILEEVSIVLDGSGTLEDPYQLTQCYTITESGYYQLQNNITGVVGDCIVIEADDVFIDGAGFTISSSTDDVDRLNQAIETEGYNRISISNITIDGFYDGIMLWNSEGESTITNVTITNSLDDSIDLQGVSDVTISESTLGVAGDDGIQVRAYDDEVDTFIASSNITITGVDISNIESNGIEAEGVAGLVITDVSIEAVFDGNGIDIDDAYNPYLDESVQSSEIEISSLAMDDIYNDGININDSQNIEIDNVTISNVGEEGIDMDNVLSVDITNNEISEIEYDAIHIESAEDIVISGNTISNIGSDGVYVNDSTNVTVSENTIDSTGTDGIDFSYDEDDNQDITITNNTLTNIGDNGIELDEVYGATITGNSMQIAGDGIAVDDSEDIEFTNNTITPTAETYLAIPENEFNFLTLDVENAENSISGQDDDSFTYTLPFTFDFMGRDIIAIEVNTNGAIELLTDGEDCEICDEYGLYSEYFDNDVIFSSFDDLAVYEDGYVAVYDLDDEGGERVVVEFYGSTLSDSDVTNYPMHIQTVLYPNGTIEWNFNEMSFENYGYEMFTGVYDFEEGTLYQAGRLIDESGVGYAGDFSGNGDFELVEGFYSNIGLDLDNVADSSFTGNNIRASQWVYAVDLENVVFNDTDSGNTYYLLNGDGAWTIFDIIDSNNNGFAESGNDRPFSEEKLTSTYWEGEGQDFYPATELRNSVVNSTPRRKSGASISRRIHNLKNMGKDEDAERLIKGIQKNDTPVQLQLPIINFLVRDLKINDSGEDVRALQQLLISKGYSIPAGSTGFFGSQTQNALITYQKANSIYPPFGYFGPITRAQMKSSGLSGLWW